MKDEFEQLRTECDQIRRERDDLRSELNGLRERASALIGAEVRAIKSELPRQVTEEITGTAKRFLWAAGLLLAAGSLGGFLTLSRIVDESVKSTITERQKDFDDYRQALLQNLLNLSVKAALISADIDAQSEELLKKIEAANKKIEASNDHSVPSEH